MSKSKAKKQSSLNVDGVMMDGKMIHIQTDLTLDKEGLNKATGLSLVLKSFFSPDSKTTPSKFDFNPFDNESQCLVLHDMTVENRLDRVSVYGKINTGSLTGIVVLQQVLRALELVLHEMQAREPLPEKLENKPTETVVNPF